MKFSAAAVLAAVAGVQAFSNVTYTTEVVTAVTTFCPEATELTYGGTTYTITEVRWTNRRRDARGRCLGESQGYRYRELPCHFTQTTSLSRSASSEPEIFKDLSLTITGYHPDHQGLPLHHQPRRHRRPLGRLPHLVRLDLCIFIKGSD